VRYNAGGAAWTYPISGMGFSALLLTIGVIPYRQADFPFAAIEIAVATPIAAWWLVRLWRQPTIATLLGGYALTLLAFLFFGRYFQGNYLGFIGAVFTPVPFLAAGRPQRVRRVREARVGRVRGIAAARGSLRPGTPAVPAPARAGWPPGPIHLSIGVFDGVHIGHRALIAELVGGARQRRATPVAATFDPLPIQALAPGAPPSALSDVQQRVRLLREAGADAVVVF